jgi:hypothetical protein
LPSHGLFDNGIDVRQLITNVEVRKAIATDNGRDFGLSFLLHLWVTNHSQEEGLNGSNCLDNSKSDA